MTFPINTAIPNIDNDPADDVGPINQNFININGFLSVDHIAPSDIGAGYHEQVTYFNLLTPAAPPGSPGGPYGIAYAKAGQTQPTVGQQYWINDKGNFPMSAIRVVGQFDTVQLPSNQTLNQFVNVAVDGVNPHPSQNTYNFTIATGAISSAKPLVFVSIAGQEIGVGIGYSYSSGTLTINTPNFIGPFLSFTINFFIMEL